MCVPGAAHQGVITRQCWSDELRAVISLLRLHSASRSVSSLMLLSTPTSPAVNPAAKPADAITRGNAPVPALWTRRAPHRQIPGRGDGAPARSGVYKNVRARTRDARSIVIGATLPSFQV